MKRVVLAILVASLIPFTVFASVAVTGSASGLQVTVNASTSNMIVVFSKNEGSGVTSVHDSAGNTYSLANASSVTSVLFNSIWYATNIATSTALVVSTTLSGGSSFPNTLVWGLSGMATSNVVDSTSSVKGTTAKTLTTPAKTTHATDTIIGGLGTEGGSITNCTAGKMYGVTSTLDFNKIGADTCGESRISVPASSGTSSITYTGTSAAQEQFLTAAFVEATSSGGGGGGTPAPQMAFQWITDD